MLESGQIEVGVEFTVDACQNVQIECRGHAQWIVIGENHPGYGLFQIGAKQQSIAWDELLPDFPEELGARLTIEITDGAAEEKDQRLLARLAARRHGL